MKVKILLLLVVLALGYVLTNMFRTKSLSEKEKNAIPYVANDILVFQSNRSEVDTIRIKEILVRKHPPNLGDMFWAKNVEILRVRSDKDCKNCDEIMTVSKQNYTSETLVSFDLILNGKRYYQGTDLKVLTKRHPEQLIVKGDTLQDVVRLERTTTKSHPGHVDRIYWSKSRGIVRIDVDAGYFWEMVNQ
ncbi:MAG: hypothetical protein AAF466_03200 [Bacteroidota bacterium]